MLILGRQNVTSYEVNILLNALALVQWQYVSRFMDLCAHSVSVCVGGPARCAYQRCLVTVHLTR